MSAGYVYVLSNPSMPGVVKIGRSIHGGKGRASDLYRNDTGVPTPFELVFEIYSPDCVEAEKKAHSSISELRINPKREFFKVHETTVIGHIIVIVMDQYDVIREAEFPAFESIRAQAEGWVH